MPIATSSAKMLKLSPRGSFGQAGDQGREQLQSAIALQQGGSGVDAVDSRDGAPHEGPRSIQTRRKTFARQQLPAPDSSTSSNEQYRTWRWLPIIAGPHRRAAPRWHPPYTENSRVCAAGAPLPRAVSAQRRHLPMNLRTGRLNLPNL